MMYRNLYYLLSGIVLGAVLGVLVCDETKKEIMKAIQGKAKSLYDSGKSTTEKTMDTVKSSVKD